MRRRGGGGGDGGIDEGDVFNRREIRRASPLKRAVSAVYAFIKAAEFEILFVLFLIIAFIAFKDLMSRPEYNQMWVKKPGGDGFWPR